MVKTNSDRTLIFDCDGVILDSNEIKTESFWEIIKSYSSEKVADEFIVYHKANGGISRHRKFEYFFTEMFPVKENREKLIREAIAKYGDMVFSKLLTCQLIPGVEEFLRTNTNEKFVVSGGLQTELREVFKQRHLERYFTSIHGSPETKAEILTKYVCMDHRNRFAFFGDSRADYEAALPYKMDFVFVSGRSEFKDWKSFFNDKQINVIRDFNDPKLETLNLA